MFGVQEETISPVLFGAIVFYELAIFAIFIMPYFALRFFVYKKALGAAAHREALKAEQRLWLQQMHSQCANAAFQCIEQNYKDRLTRLKAY